jgi:YesN/AraC family two-component response regulator
MRKEIRRLKSDFPAGTDFFVERREAKAGKHFLPHWHDYIELELILEGRGEHIYNCKHYALKRGSAYLMTYYDFHELYVYENMVLLKIQCDERILPKEIQEHIRMRQGSLHCELTEQDTEYIAKLWERLQEECTQNLLLREQMIQNLITSVIIALLRNASVVSRLELPSILQTVTAYIHAHFQEDINLTQLAKLCAVTPNYLGMQFSKWLGVSLSEYVNKIRLRHACNLLLGTDLSVKEIAFASGYNSVEYFLDRFKRKISCTPTAFRKNNRRKE